VVSAAKKKSTKKTAGYPWPGSVAKPSATSTDPAEVLQALAAILRRRKQDFGHYPGLLDWYAKLWREGRAQQVRDYLDEWAARVDRDWALWDKGYEAWVSVLDRAARACGVGVPPRSHAPGFEDFLVESVQRGQSEKRMATR